MQGYLPQRMAALNKNINIFYLYNENAFGYSNLGLELNLNEEKKICAKGREI